MFLRMGLPKWTELLLWVTHNLLWPLKVRWTAKWAVRSRPRPLPLLCPAFWPPSRSYTQNGSSKAVRKQTSKQLLVFPPLPLCATRSQTTAAHDSGGGKARRRAQRYANKFRGNQRRYVACNDPGYTNHH